VDSTAGRPPVAPTLLVRRAVLAGEQHVAALLRDVPVDPPEVADLIRHHGVFVLADLTLPLSARPVAAAAFRYHRHTATAQVAGVGVLVTLRRRGLGCRLLTGALTLLRAEGFARVHASAASGGAGASLLASAGFAVDGDAARAGGCSRFALVL
jgi:ribosomal protein S18 acetylase RimI-like enzyme